MSYIYLLILRERFNSKICLQMNLLPEQIILIYFDIDHERGSDVSRGGPRSQALVSCLQTSTLPSAWLRGQSRSQWSSVSQQRSKVADSFITTPLNLKRQANHV